MTKLGRESGSMTRAMAVLGYFLKMATMAALTLVLEKRVCLWLHLRSMYSLL